jgi:23S rRNA pseudouridine2605 synthase
MPRGKVKNRKKKIVHSWNHKINPEINKQISTGSKVSLVRALSKLGYCSRTRAVELIQQGRVQVNQTVEVALSRWIDLNRDLIQVDGKPITAAEKIYLMLNKPRGLITTLNDEKGRETIFNCLNDPKLPWISPVGRLDKASEGLLLLTNDTRWAAAILNPASHLDKTYHVQIRGKLDQEMLNTFKRGIVEQGELLKAKEIKIIRQGSKNCWLEIVLDEGRNRQLRRMFQAVDFPVLRLIRIAVGPIALGDLKKGEYRHLTHAEQRSLRSVDSFPRDAY